MQISCHQACIDAHRCTANHVHHMSGVLQACVSLRKQGKKLAVYDLKLEVAWVGQLSRVDAKPVEGLVTIREFATESDEDDWVLECTTTETGSDAVREPDGLPVCRCSVAGARLLHRCTLHSAAQRMQCHTWHMLCTLLHLTFSTLDLRYEDAVCQEWRLVCLELHDMLQRCTSLSHLQLLCRTRCGV